MWISSIHIQNFRPFSNVDLTLNKGLNTFVGENSVGKSSVALAISKLLHHYGSPGSGTPISNNDLRYGDLINKMSSIKCLCNFEEAEKKEICSGLFSGTTAQKKKDQLYEQLEPVLNNLEVIHELEETGTRTYAKLGPMYIRNKYISSQLRFAGNTTSINRFIDQVISQKADIPSMINILGGVNLWESDGVQERQGQLLESRLKLFSEFRLRPSSSSRGGSLESYGGSDTASVLLNLKNHSDRKQRDKYKYIRSKYNSFFPKSTIEVVENSPGSGIADIQFIESGMTWPIPLANIEAGVTELLTFITNLATREDFIFVIEEPEIHLHPHAKRQLMGLIKESAKHNQIIVITHDPCFIDSDNMESVIRFAGSAEGTKPYSLPSDLTATVKGKLKTAMKDPLMQEVVFARAVLVVEDESQRNFIMGCADRLMLDLNSNGVSVIPTDGDGNYKPYIKLLESFNIPFICLKDKKWDSSNPPAIYRSLGCEIEDYLVNNDLGDLLEEAKKKVGNSKPRWNKFVGKNIKPEQVPQLFLDLINDVIGLA